MTQPQHQPSAPLLWPEPHPLSNLSMRDRRLAGNLLHDWRTGEGVESGAGKVIPDDCLLNTRRLKAQQDRKARRRPRP